MTTPQFTDLILLIGTNPLPNFVVAEYFLQNYPELKTIWLVHSEQNDDANQEGTLDQAENLQCLLQKKMANNNSDRTLAFAFVALSNVSRAKAIERDLNKKCLNELANRDVHLNYTGGTKAMATHVYRFLERHEGLQKQSFSYLDAREFKILFDDDRIRDSHDLRKHVSLTFEEMITLHGFERKNTGFQNLAEGKRGRMITLHGFERKNTPAPAPFAAALTAFSQIIQSGKLAEYFDRQKGGYNRKFFEEKDRPGKLATTINQVDWTRLQTLRPNPSFTSVLNALPVDYQIFQNGKFSANGLENNCCKKLIRFLDGLLLEEYVCSVLRGAFPPNEMEIDTNWEIKQPTWNTHFELDVLLIKGYQLIGISCTRDAGKARCKGKGFEIIQRTRQIGGIEAKAVVVTFLDKSTRKVVEEELQMDTGSGKNILVLGIDDLEKEKLLKQIKKFIKD